MNLLRRPILGFCLLNIIAIGAISVSNNARERRQNTFEKTALPNDYEERTAAEKEDLLYKQMEATRYSSLPPLQSVNPIKFLMSALQTKMDLARDEAPGDYQKAIHAHAVTARVRFEADPGSPYTGLFQGAGYGILRISITADSKGKDFAPGFALKLLVDGKPSENLSALYMLSGQGSDHNFFAHELSNIIPSETDPKSIFSQSVFKSVSRNPTRISVKPLAAIDQTGQAVDKPQAPVQLYFVPDHANDLPKEAHDFREDFIKIPPGVAIYEVYATDESGDDSGKVDEERRKGAKRIGRLITKSPFIASEFGDKRIFFRHYNFENN